MKKAIIVASFGCSMEDVRDKNIKPIEEAVKKEYKEMDVFRVFTSNMIRRRLDSEFSLHIMDMKECLENLKQEGYKEVFVLPTHIIPGVEYEKITRAVSKYADSFESIKVARPFLDDRMGEKEVEVLLSFLSDKRGEEGSAVVLMGHGSNHEAHSYYAKFEKLLKERGEDHYLINVEWADFVEDIYEVLKQKGYSHIDLYPLMIVAGDHAINDMASDEEDSIKTKLKSQGFSVTAHLKGLGGEEQYHKLCLSRLAEIMN
ncbi:MAG: sirohydrochlorin cobaltochelatase [Filifactor alocis]|nr:sirohydrochlorin cobaltochelatase [Filifactor alocis]